jgi:hypothetical protein
MEVWRVPLLTAQLTSPSALSAAPLWKKGNHRYTIAKQGKNYIAGRKENECATDQHLRLLDPSSCNTSK